MAGKKRDHSNLTCHYCQKKGHIAPNCHKKKLLFVDKVSTTLYLCLYNNAPSEPSLFRNSLVRLLLAHRGWKLLLSLISSSAVPLVLGVAVVVVGASVVGGGGGWWPLQWSG